MIDLDYLDDGIRGKFKTSSCVRIAAALGITCKENSCDECKRKEAGMIEKLAKNACVMYDVNGEMVAFGDYVEYDGKVYEVAYANGVGNVADDYTEIRFKSYGETEYLQKTEMADKVELLEIPEDQDGEKIRIGDTVYSGSVEYTVLWYVTGGREIYAKREGHTERVILDVLNITHKKPETDTLDKIKADAIAFYKDYFGCSSPYRSMCDKCPSLIEGKKPYVYYDTLSCIQAKDLDIIRRVQEVCSRV